MQRRSDREEDAITWTNLGVPIGPTGLDLREPAEPGSLTALRNARFPDDRTTQPRDGHTAIAVRDGSDLAALGVDYNVSDDWVYGHGVLLSGENAASWENAHHPFVGRGAATFELDGTDVVWTGDRLLSIGDPGIGESAFWRRSTVSTPLKRGVPAYLPLMVDSSPPAPVSGSYVETCLTDTLRIHAYNDGATLMVWLVDRATGVHLSNTDVSGVSANPGEIRLINSGGVRVVTRSPFSGRRSRGSVRRPTRSSGCGTSTRRSRGATARWSSGGTPPPTSSTGTTGRAPPGTARPSSTTAWPTRLCRWRVASTFSGATPGR